MRGSLQSYRKVSLDTQLADASPHKITQMLLAGALERVAQSKYAIEHNNTAAKGELIGKAIGIIQGLRNCLVMDDDSEVGTNLSNLYEFMLASLTRANVENNAAILDDVSEVLRTIKEGWDAIPHDMHHITAHAS
ncbi:flagella export chaperone FliS [Parashewanella spongiae]|uniref:Flagellar secretion chaperone FliS n=1 Tax=Parashewanella spongiae TaxID=342950 RepID=A0A3A6U5T5_9GAMM|nr:flagellar export chaperone FliS [Parashewanella spongiae]MCL1076625.1 flagellar export chaperone FliS [Parashewanella spongiae]RJY19579.1 flagella export chaperone FliS [Parashewanella spongiae]